MYLDTNDTYTDENGATYSTSEEIVDNTTTHETDKSIIDIIDNIERLTRALRKHIVRTDI
jgi:hypothetical protein